MIEVNSITTGQKFMIGGKKDSLITPADLLVISLCSCVLMTMEAEAHTLGVDISDAEIRFSKEIQRTPLKRISKIIIHFSCPQIFDPKITQILEESCQKCTVHQSLHPEIIKEYHFQWGILKKE